jgi:iron(III) transport system permease protein
MKTGTHQWLESRYTQAFRAGWKPPSRWQAASAGIALLVLAPMVVVLFSFFQPADEIWRHLAETILSELLVNTFWLILGVGTLTTVLGVSLAWFTVTCDFPGRKFFDWALVLPLAMPAYVIAFVSIGLFDFSGPVQTALRGWLGTPNLWFPPIRSTGGVIAVMSLAFYPYVYLLSRNAFLTQGRRGIEAAQSLGYGPRSAFFRVALPMARPWIAAGLMLVLMETLADFGAVSTFNYDTLTTAIYKAWFGMFSLPAAAQLSSILVLIVFVLVLLEQKLRSGSRYTSMERQSAPQHRIVLRGPRRWAVSAYALTVLSAAFFIPVTQLAFWTVEGGGRDLDGRYFGFLTHSVFLGTIAALITTGCAVILVYTTRLSNTVWNRLMVRLATLGYALPGAVLAIGGIILVTWVDNRLIAWAQNLLGIRIGLFITGTLFAMLLAYLARFLVVAHNPLESAMQRITPSTDEASKSLGLSGLRMLRKVHLPMLRGGLLTAMVLVFVDVMKEMPITLMTRPFGWDTLAVRIFEMTSEGEWERAALPAVALVLAGLVPVALLTRQAGRSS